MPAFSDLADHGEFDNVEKAQILNELKPKSRKTTAAPERRFAAAAAAVAGHRAECSGKVPLEFPSLALSSFFSGRSGFLQQNVERDKILDFERILRPPFIFNGKPFGLSLKDVTHTPKGLKYDFVQAGKEGSARLCTALCSDIGSRQTAPAGITVFKSCLLSFRGIQGDGEQSISGQNAVFDGKPSPEKW